MMPSRGMGDINPSKMPKKKVIERTDNPDAVDMYATGGELKEVPEDNVGLSKLPEDVRNKMGYMKDGGEVWNKPRPKGLGAPKKMSSAKKAKAKAMAKAAGRPYPNLVDNMRAARKK